MYSFWYQAKKRRRMKSNLDRKCIQLGLMTGRKVQLKYYKQWNEKGKMIRKLSNDMNFCLLLGILATVSFLMSYCSKWTFIGFELVFSPHLYWKSTTLSRVPSLRREDLLPGVIPSVLILSSSLPVADSHSSSMFLGDQHKSLVCKT